MSPVPPRSRSRWVAGAASQAKPVLETLEAAYIPDVQTFAVDRLSWGHRPSSASGQRMTARPSRRAKGDGIELSSCPS